MGTDPLRESLLAFIRRHELLVEGSRVIVGVSGGIDSIVLLHLLQNDFRPVAVHIDHEMRPDSARDAEFVKALAQSWDIESRTVRIEVPDGASRQGQAREERYRALERVASERGINAVAAAHHRADVAETLLLQLARGAGPRGWRAMPVSRPIQRGSTVRLIRPLRFASRSEIEAYARAHGLEWREDPSNAALDYRRAVIRTRVLPLLTEHFGEGAVDRIAAAAELAEDYLESGAALASDEAMVSALIEPGALSIEVLRGMEPVVRRGVILEVLARDHPDVPRSSSAVTEVDGLLDSQVGRKIEVGPVTIWREREVLRFTRSSPVRFAGNVSVPGRLDTPQGTLTVEMLSEEATIAPGDSLREVVDADRIGPSLFLRTWSEGDRLSPLGLDGTKKVSDLLTDCRVPPSDRGRQLVLVAGDEIVWVVGRRLAEPFRIRAETRRAAELRWEPR